jgi:hypothetical protein
MRGRIYLVVATMAYPHSEQGVSPPHSRRGPASCGTPRMCTLMQLNRSCTADLVQQVTCCAALLGSELALASGACFLLPPRRLLPLGQLRQVGLRGPGQGLASCFRRPIVLWHLRGDRGRCCILPLRLHMFAQKPVNIDMYQASASCGDLPARIRCGLANSIGGFVPGQASACSGHPAMQTAATAACAGQRTG